MRKLFTFFFALMVTTSLWAYDFQSGDLYFNITNDTIAPYTIEVTYQRLHTTKNYAGLTTVTIPETVIYNGTTYSVTSVGNDAFSDCSSLKSITIPESVTSIGNDAFSDCSSLKSITIPESVTSIGNNAFSHCLSLMSITIPESVTSIGNEAFLFCIDLTSIAIPNSITSIGNGLFRDCHGLRSITIPNSVTNIGYSAFSQCSSLTSVTIGENVTSIGNSVFSQCTRLTSITIPNSVTSIGNYAFSQCSSLTSVTIGENVTSIGDYAFSQCSSLTSVTIGENVTSIGKDAFFQCSSLTSVTIPNSVTSIGDHAFSQCTRLTSITIPNSVTSIGYGAFYYCTSLTSVTIGENVTSIGKSAFSQCTRLTSVTIGENVTSIGNSAFSQCTRLTSITIPNSVTSIGDHAFHQCSSLTSVTIGENVTSIGNEAFIETAIYNNELNWENGVLYIGNYLIDVQTTKSNVSIKEDTRLIANYAFYKNWCDDIIIPQSVMYIGNYAFHQSDVSRIFLNSTTPPVIMENSLISDNLSCIYVPLAAIGNYYESWKRYDFANKITTDEINMHLQILNRTQTTISLRSSFDFGNANNVISCGIEWSEEDDDSYYNRLYFPSNIVTNDTIISNLKPNTIYYFRAFYKIENGETHYTIFQNNCLSYPISTYTLSITATKPFVDNIGQTYALLGVNNDYGDANLISEMIEIESSTDLIDVTGRNDVIINNLDPNTTHRCRSVLSTKEGGTQYGDWVEFTTEPITLSTGDADGISNSSAFLHGTIDCDTMSRTEIGFEWKRSDAPSTVKPQRLLVVDRVDENLIFRLEGLSSDRYYDFRTFCLYNGKEYYGEWVGFLTSDKDILIPPSVQTREAEISDLGVLMKGFVVAGTEVILQRGFECWREESDQVATTVAEGAIMSSYIPEAWSYTTYKYRAYAKTPAGTTYGETLEVTTEYIATNIADIIVNASSNSAQVTWTMVEQADYYILTLYSDESMTEVIAVYTVDKNGNVTQKRVASATQSLVTCELTELLPETNYYFAVKAYNNNDQMVAEENGSFATTVVPTAVENAHSQSPMTNCQKIIHDNQLLILRDGNTYNVMGVIVE